MSVAILHHAIAERGKALALAGEHVDAMLHYREAMTLAVGGRAPEVVFRHYMECSLESLERMGEFAEVARYCELAIQHYAANLPQHALSRLDLATIHQRHGVALLKAGRPDEAREALRRAVDEVASDDRPMPLASTLLGWLSGRMHVSPQRLEGELKRHRYYAVRKGNVKGPGPMAAAVDAAMAARRGLA